MYHMPVRSHYEVQTLTVTVLHRSISWAITMHFADIKLHRMHDLVSSQLSKGKRQTKGLGIGGSTDVSILLERYKDLSELVRILYTEEHDGVVYPVDGVTAVIIIPLHRLIAGPEMQAMNVTLAAVNWANTAKWV